MVYESDFYTTRRPYSSSRPYVSSYNITPLRGPFYLYNPYYVAAFLRTLPHMPYTAHKRLVTVVHTPVRIYHAGTYLPIKIHSRVRPSIIAAELNRIRYLTRPSYQSYTEKYLNSKDYIDFDDETREIRAKTDNLLRRIHVFIPRPSLSDYDETAPERLRSDDYVRRIINAKNARKEIESLPWYTTPEKRDIGTGHLACIKYAGGRPQSRRRPYYTVGDLVPGDVRSDVNLMSYYVKNRKAAEDAYQPNIHHVTLPREAHNAPAPSVTWADDVERVEETVEEEVPAETEPELDSKPETLKAQENNEAEEMEEAEYDENGVKKQPDEDTIKRVQEYLQKKANEKKMEEERRAWEAAERRRIAEEKEIARLAALKIEEDIRIAEIKEQERAEAERQAVIARAEAARQEAERLIEDEKLYNEAVAQAVADEQERLAKEMKQEEKKKNEEEEETENLLMAASNSLGSELVVDEAHTEEHSIHADLSDQDVEAKPYEVDQDEITQIEEDEHEDQDELKNPFADGEGSASSPLVDEPVTSSPQIKERGGAGGEQGFDWSQYDNEAEAEEAEQEAQAPQAEAEATSADDQQHNFDEAEVEGQAEADEATVEEMHAPEDAHDVEAVEEVQVEESAAETEEAAEEAQDEAAQETEEAQEEAAEETEEAQAEETEEAEATEETQQEEAQVEEAKSEEKSVHSASEEEDEEQDDE